MRAVPINKDTPWKPIPRGLRRVRSLRLLFRPGTELQVTAIAQKVSDCREKTEGPLFQIGFHGFFNEFADEVGYRRSRACGFSDRLGESLIVGIDFRFDELNRNGWLPSASIRS